MREFLKDRKRRPEEGQWEPQISFEIFDHCPKITSSANKISEAKIPKPTRDKSTKRVLGKVETQRNRQNVIWNLNEQTVHKTEPADCRQTERAPSSHNSVRLLCRLPC
jgi:hypothetical protein